MVFFPPEASGVIVWPQNLLPPASFIRPFVPGSPFLSALIWLASFWGEAQGPRGQHSVLHADLGTLQGPSVPCQRAGKSKDWRL